jgi:hypothetical protein
MGTRERKSGKLLLDTGEFRVITGELIEAARDKVAEDMARAKQEELERTRRQCVPWPLTPTPSDSGEALRKFVHEEIDKAQVNAQNACVASGPIATLRGEYRDDMQQLQTTITTVLNEQATSRGKELARVQFVGWIIAALSGVGVLFNIAWTLSKAVHS